MKTCIVSILALLAMSVAPNRMLAEHCDSVRAQIIDRSSPEGCISPLKVCIAGTVKGNRGLNGTTYFVLDGIADAPTTAAGFKSSTGTLVYTTKQGTLTVRETGTGKLSGHPSNGYGSGVQEVISGTGRFAGLTGILYISQKDVLGTFTSDVTGQLCTAAAPTATNPTPKAVEPVH
jgi:hypothetical protein